MRNGLAGTYTKLTPRERLHVLIAAGVRDDCDEVRRILDSVDRSKVGAHLIRPELAFRGAMTQGAVLLSSYVGQLRVLQGLQTGIPVLELLRGKPSQAERSAGLMADIIGDIEAIEVRAKRDCEACLTALDDFARKIGNVSALDALKLCAPLVAYEIEVLDVRTEQALLPCTIASKTQSVVWTMWRTMMA